MVESEGSGMSHGKEVPPQWVSPMPERVMIRSDMGVLFVKRPSNSVTTNSSIGCYSSASSGEHHLQEQQEQEQEQEEGKCSTSSDPYVTLIEKAREVRQRTHRANNITTRIRDISYQMVVQRVEESLHVGKIREQLYREFEEEFAAALRAMQEMKFFGSLTQEERMMMPVARANFLSSRKNLLRNEANQLMLLSSHLSTAWNRQHQLRQEIARCELVTQPSCARRVSAADAEHAGRETPLLCRRAPVSVDAGGNHKSFPSYDGQSCAHMCTLQNLFHDLQSILAMQRERLGFLQAEEDPVIHPAVAKAPAAKSKDKRGSKTCSFGCCCIL